jgi:hypothetical protein
MTEDRLLKELARVAREQQAQEPDRRWDDLAAGRLAPEEVERLREEARRSPEAAAAWELFQPLDAGFQRQVVAQAQRGLQAAQAPSAAPTRRPRRLWLAPALAAAALLVVVARWNRAPVLPSYDLRLDGAVRVERSTRPEDAATVPEFAPGNRFELRLTPATSAGDVEAQAFVLRDGRVEPLSAPPPARSSDGAVRFLGIVGEDVQLPAGSFRLLVAVGRRGSLPGGEVLRERLALGSPIKEDRWIGWTVDLRTAPAP